MFFDNLGNDRRPIIGGETDKLPDEGIQVTKVGHTAINGLERVGSQTPHGHLVRHQDGRDYYETFDDERPQGSSLPNWDETNNDQSGEE